MPFGHCAREFLRCNKIAAIYKSHWQHNKRVGNVSLGLNWHLFKLKTFDYVAYCIYTDFCNIWHKIKKITVGRLFPNFIRGKEKKQNEYHQNFVYYNEWKHKRYSSRPLLCKRLFHTIHDTFTIILGYYTFRISFWAVLCWVRRAKISMRLTGLHCLAVLCLIVSYIDKYIIQVIWNGIWETMSTCIVFGSEIDGPTQISC